MILAAVQALLVWVFALLATNAEAHPLPDPPPAVTAGDPSPTARHLAPPVPTTPADVAPAPVCGGLPPEVADQCDRDLRADQTLRHDQERRHAAERERKMAEDAARTGG